MQLSGVSSVQKWQVPPVGWYKLNVDVAVDIDPCSVGYSVVVCNSNGQVMVVGVEQRVFSS